MDKLEARIRKALATDEYKLIPEHAGETLIRYACHRLPTGGAFKALLSNDLFDFVGRADEEYTAAIVPLVKLIYNHFPASCHGSPEKVSRWIANVREEEPSLASD